MNQHDRDAALVEDVAREWVERHGSAAVAHLRDQAEIAEGIGDTLSAGAWQDIAAAVEACYWPRPRP